MQECRPVVAPLSSQGRGKKDKAAKARSVLMAFSSLL